MALIGSVAIGTRVDTSGFKQGFDKAANQARMFAQNIGRQTASIKPIDIAVSGSGDSKEAASGHMEAFTHISKQVENIGKVLRAGIISVLPVIGRMSSSMASVADLADHFHNKIFDRKLKTLAESATSPFVKNLAKGMQYLREMEDKMKFLSRFASKGLGFLGIGRRGIPSVLGAFSGKTRQGQATRQDSGGMGLGGSLALGLGGGLAVGEMSSGVKRAVKANNELVSATNRVKAVLGDESELVQKTAVDFSKLGVNQTEYVSAATSFAAAFKNTGSSAKEAAKLGNELTKVGLNLAAFNDKDPSEAFTALQAALRGEFDPLERFNVFLNADALAVEAVAMGLAKSTDAVDANAKKQAALNLILKQSADANGALGKEAGETGSRLRSIAGSIENAFQNVGAILDPIVNRFLEFGQAVFGALNEQIQANLASWKTWTTEVASSGGSVVSVLGGIGSTIGVVADVINLLKLGWKAQYAAFQTGLKFILKGLTEMVKAIDYVLQSMGLAATGASDFLGTMADGMTNEAEGAWKDFMDALAAPPPSEGIKTFFDDVQRKMEETRKQAEDTKTAINATATTPASKAQKEREKKLKADAKDILKDIQTPAEKFKEEMEKIGSVFLTGALSQGQRDRALKKAFVDKNEAQGPFKFAGANDVNSKEFYSAMIGARFGSTNPTKRLEKLAEDQLGTLRQISSNLGHNRKFEDDETVDIL